MAEKSSIQAIQIHHTGGPDVLRLDNIPTPDLAPGTVLIKVHFAGVNYIDIYMRSGIYPHDLPITLGLEGAGQIIAVAPDVTEFKPMDRVAWADVAGSYATHLVAPISRLVLIPEDITYQQAAAVMLQGMTAHYLTHSAFPLKKGDTCLVHAAAGGVGLLLCQLAKMCGATVIGTVSTEAKAALAFGAGADHIIFYNKEDFAVSVLKITGGQGVEVVYDSVGKVTCEKGLAILKRRGYFVAYGQSSGALPALDPQILSKKSLFFTRSVLFDYISTREELLSRSHDIFTWLQKGKLNLRIDSTYPLADAHMAHAALEQRKTSGKLLLVTDI